MIQSRSVCGVTYYEMPFSPRRVDDVKKILFASVWCAPPAIWSQDIKPVDIKPGLWENTTTSQDIGVAMPTMPQLTPEQLAKMPTG